MGEEMVKSFDGTRIWSYYHKSDHDCIILIHGLGGVSTGFEKMLSVFRRLGYSYIIADAVGHGLSEKPKNPERYSLENIAEDFIAMADHYRVKKFHLLGFSFGSAIAQIIADRHRQRVMSCVLMGSSNRFSESLWEKILLYKLMALLKIGRILFWGKIIRKDYTHDDMYSSLRYIPDIDVKRFLIDLRHSVDVDSFIWCLLHLMQFDGTEILGRSQVAILFIHGGNDTLVPLQNARRAQRLVKNSEMFIISPTGHILTLNAPEDCALLAARFIRRHRKV
jgi:pimeloyl-ACP methyl ester carboxylesterase